MNSHQMDLRGFGRLLLTWLLVATALLTTARLGYALAVPTGAAHTGWVPFWLPGGAGLACLLLLGLRAWPGVFAGALAGELSLGQPLTGALSFALPSVLEALLGAYLIGRFAGGASALNSIRGLCILIAAAGAAAFFISAPAGAAGLLQAGLVHARDLGAVWLSWGIGNLAGVMILTPLLLAAARQDFRAWGPAHWLEAGLVLALTYALTEAVFGPWLPSLHDSILPAFLPLLALVWGGLRLGPLGASAAAALLAGSALWHTAQGLGVFASAAPQHTWLALQSYVLLSIVSALVLAVAMAGRRSALQSPMPLSAGEEAERETHAPVLR